jgi:hypothetical protein
MRNPRNPQPTCSATLEAHLKSRHREDGASEKSRNSSINQIIIVGRRNSPTDEVSSVSRSQLLRGPSD